MKPHSTAEERLRLAVAVAQIGIIELDYLNDIAVADDKAAELFGLASGQTLCRDDVHRRFHPEDLAEIERRVEESLKPDGKGEFQMQHRVVHDDGQIRWVDIRKRIFFDDIDGKRVPARGMVAAIDITEQKESEHRLRSGEDRLRIAAETTGFGTYDIGAGSEQPVWSDQIYRIFGLEPNVPLTRSAMFEQVHQDDRSHYRELFQRLIQKDADENFKLEHRIVRPNGEIRWVINSGCVLSERGRATPTRVVGTMQDITNRKLFEQSLKSARDEAEKANRSRGEFLANMSHEIRTPMAAIIGHADILRDHLKDPDNIQVVETIRRNGNFLLGILNDILDLSKIDAGKLEVELQPARPDEIVAEVRSLMDVRAAEKKLPLKIEFDGEIPEIIQTDAIRMRQILLNLVGNAIKFTDDGEVRLTVRYEGDTNRLLFQVVDTGVGIDPEDLGSLFDPFVQADNTSTRTVGGTGLGLAICQRLAKALSGEVDVESEQGVGSKFTLSIAVSEDVRLVKPDLSLSICSFVPQGEIELSARVLVVDDRRDIRYLAQHFIERAGGEVVTATNGQEAVDFITSDESEDVDLIVMDMQMPVMDGYDATSKLRSQGYKLPIIALTANAMKSDRDACLAAGCTDYTTKPLDSKLLIGMIDQLTRL
ncbi:ATP-binding protein [Planctomycetes bacterium K23_9]|uniref:histidine kinase n=1 Tax=Stieleria marina TaxID=1930275 RepID=A0A517NXV5_9BACT|nr:Autoinducer 2 sensor kinase/phosphatase LuxQ [Planctomycetes bacterium K23_9]